MDIGTTTEIVLITEPGMDMVTEPGIIQVPIMSAQRLICPAMQIGTAMEIGMRTTIDMGMEIAGWDTEVMGERAQEGAGNNECSGAALPLEQQTLKSKTTDK